MSISQTFHIGLISFSDNLSSAAQITPALNSLLNPFSKWNVPSSNYDAALTLAIDEFQNGRKGATKIAIFISGNEPNIEPDQTSEYSPCDQRLFNQKNTPFYVDLLKKFDDNDIEFYGLLVDMSPSDAGLDCIVDEGMVTTVEDYGMSLYKALVDLISIIDCPCETHPPTRAPSLSPGECEPKGDDPFPDMDIWHLWHIPCDMTPETCETQKEAIASQIQRANFGSNTFNLIIFGKRFSTANEEYLRDEGKTGDVMLAILGGIDCSSLTNEAPGDNSECESGPECSLQAKGIHLFLSSPFSHLSFFTPCSRSAAGRSGSKRGW